MSATPKKMAQPRKSQPSTLMPAPLPCWPSASLARTDGVALRRIAAGPHARVMQVEGRPLGPDLRDGREVVPRRRAGRRPLQRVGEAPRVVFDDTLPVLPRLVDVPEEDEVRHAEYERADARDLVKRRGEMRQEGVVGGAPRLAHHAQPVLHEEGRIEADEHEPEVPLAERLVELLARPLRPPEVEAAEHAEHDRAE